MGSWCTFLSRVREIVFVCEIPCFLLPILSNQRKGLSRALMTLVYLSIILTIMIQLKPEIYRLIVKALVSPDDGSTSKSSASSKQHSIASHSSGTLIGKDQQASLATMMRVSNVSTRLFQVARLMSRFFTISAKPNYTETA